MCSDYTGETLLHKRLKSMQVCSNYTDEKSFHSRLDESIKYSQIKQVGGPYITGWMSMQSMLRLHKCEVLT